MLGLLVAFRVTEPVTRAIARRFPVPPMRMDVLIFRSHPTGQFRSYVVALAVTFLCVGAFAVLDKVTRRRRRLALAVDAAAVAGAVMAGFSVTPFLGWAALALALPLAMLLVPHTSQLPDTQYATSPRTVDAWAVLAQTICLFWGASITGQAPGRHSVLVPVLVTGAISAWRVSTLVTATAPARDGWLHREALAGMPFLALPLLGILRAPSRLWLGAALVLYVAFSVPTRRLLPIQAWLRRLPRALPGLAGVWALTVIYSIPHKFRELPRINHAGHEAGKYAWLNSFYHGKLFMADTALLYGPLRELVLAIYVAFFGKTAEHVRQGQIVIHLGFLAAMTYMVWIAARRQLWLAGWGAFLVITTTLALPWLDVAHMPAFGWSDLGRIAFPLLPVFGALAMAGSTPVLAGWGALATLSILYSQETGPLAVVAIVAALIVDSFMRPMTPAGWWARGKRAATRAGVFLIGVIAAALVVVLIYALFGRARLFVVTFYTFVSLFASGSLAGVPFPVNEHTFMSWTALTANAPREGGFLLEYVLPVAVYLVTGAALIAAAVTRPWSRRATLILGIFVFGVGSFRVAMGRSDYYHLITVTAPAVLLVVALAADAADHLWSARRLLPPMVLPVGTLVLLLLVVGSFRLSGVSRVFNPHTKALLAGTEAPSVGAPFVYPDIPRAGDIFLPPDTIALTRAIARRTKPTDKIFVHASFIEHAELYFLADRVNPTRCDLLAEIVSTDVQDEVRRDLMRDPPVLDVGADVGMFNQATVDYLKAGWRVVESVGKIPIAARATPDH